MSYSIPVNSEDSVLIHLDSRDADKYLGTDLTTGKTLTSYFQYVLTDKIICPSNQLMLISLNDASIPYSFYNVRLGVNDAIQIKIFDFSSGAVAGSHSYDIIIPPANYSAFSLGDKLETLFDAQTANYSFNTFVSYDDDTQKFNFSIVPSGSDAGKNLGLEMLFNTGTLESRSPHIELGFDKEDKTFLKNTSLFSSNVIDINGSIHGVYIRTNLTSKSVLDSQNGNLSNILARVPIQVQAGGVIFFNARDSKHMAVVSPLEVNIITIRLTDERNRSLDLNGLHFQVGIKLDFMYRKAKVNDITAEQRRNVGLTKEQLKQKELEEILKGESDKARMKAIKLYQSGKGEVIEDDDTITIQRRKKKVGRPAKAGRPTNKELKRRIKREERREQELKIQPKTQSVDFLTF